MSERSQRLERLFAAALDQAAEQRAGFVHDACGDDAALRRDVEELLVCEAQAGEFLESPAIEQAARAAARAELAGEGVPAIGSRVSHYEVRERLRRGGMGVVFRAVDLRLHREVALKVLPPSLLPDPELRLRFGQEARAASALNHPNIVVVHDVGEHDGLPFIAMEYVPGRRLTELLEEGPLPWSVLGSLALQLARALAKAHAVGIVHRDLKPDNLMVTDDGLLKVLDFGLAKLATTGAKRVLSDVDPTGARATTPGTVMGTIGYMSPEQARGEATDSRTDQFSFGAILHELATGRPAFLRGSPAETLAAILGADPEPLDSERRAPEGLAAIVQRCLQRDHEDRFATTGELVQALERVRFDASPTPGRRLVGWARSLSAARMVIAGLLLAAAAWGLGILPDRFRLQPSMRPAIESIAVLPLENLTGDPEHEYFVDGMTDALTSDLARIEALTVISRRSAMRYKDSDAPLSEIASALDVDALVEGVVQLSGDRVRITAKLVDPQTSRYLWTETYDRNLEHALTLQRDVARAVAREMRVTITDAESARLAASYPVDPEAYRLYLKGRFHWNKRTDESLARALEYFEESSRRDPGYALAYAGLADTYAILSGHRMPAEVAAPRVKEAAHKAIELDPSLGAPHAALGVIAFEFDWDWVTMEREFRSALELSPGYATAHQWYSYCLSQLARHDEAIAEAYRARELDPISLIVNHNVGQALQFAGQLERAEREYRKTLELDPDFPDPYQLLGDLYWRQGRQEAAIAHYQRYYELLEGEGGLPIGELTRIFREAGAKGALGRMIEHYREEAPYPSGVLIAGFYARMGDFDSAIASLERAYAERDRLIIGLLIDPNLDALRPDPRFQALVERVGLPG